MLNLIPDWAEHYEDFWKSIRARNFWFIQLRYYAVVILVLFVLVGQYLIKFNLQDIQIRVILSIAVLILAFNICFNIINKKTDCKELKINCLQLSLIMIEVDLFFLTILVYITGVFFSPLYMLYVFHMIIGSLILPGWIVYVLAAVLSMINTILAIAIHYSLIPKYLLEGVVRHLNDHSVGFEIIFSIVFTFVLFTIVYLANTIAKQLYQREEELRISLKKLNEAEITKQKYTLGIVHEIKSPITAVQSILDLILSKYVAPIDEKVEEKLLRARARSNEAIALINDVLKYSRIKLLDSSLSDDIDLDEIIQKIISQHEDEIKLKKISFNFRNLVKGEKLIKGDKSLLELAFSNLISNAVKYTNDKGNIFVIITENENLLDIEISDDGIGIPEKELKDIFSQLYRASNAKKEGKEGSGMGLSIVKEIIEKHSGIIQIFSPSKIGTTTSPGTTVLITLPKKLNSNNY